MEYRRENGLSIIPISKSLNIVAQTHAKDLVYNKPDVEGCNAHSWSANGKWSACCYTPDHAQAQCMWSKPRELTSYLGNGYEIACGSNICCSSFIMTAEYAINSWKLSPNHNVIILNEWIWSKIEWNAIGIGMFKGFVSVWFGSEIDK